MAPLDTVPSTVLIGGEEKHIPPLVWGKCTLLARLVVRAFKLHDQLTAAYDKQVEAWEAAHPIVIDAEKAQDPVYATVLDVTGWGHDYFTRERAEDEEPAKEHLTFPSKIREGARIGIIGDLVFSGDKAVETEINSLMALVLLPNELAEKADLEGRLLKLSAEEGSKLAWRMFPEELPDVLRVAFAAFKHVWERAVPNAQSLYQEAMELAEAAKGKMEDLEEPEETPEPHLTLVTPTAEEILSPPSPTESSSDSSTESAPDSSTE